MPITAEVSDSSQAKSAQEAFQLLITVLNNTNITENEREQRVVQILKNSPHQLFAAFDKHLQNRQHGQLHKNQSGDLLPNPINPEITELLNKFQDGLSIDNP